MTVTALHSRGPVPLSWLDEVPDDDPNRYEIIDGRVYVSPPPVFGHQSALTRLVVLLDAVKPDGFEVVGGVGFQVGERTVLVPDLVVTHPHPYDTKYVTDPLPLAVEVISPSSRRHDRVRKLRVYSRAGVGAYWIVDPAEPSLLVFERQGDRLAETARVRGDEAYAATLPFPVCVVPAALTVTTE